MRDKCIVFLSDNQAVVDIINKQTSKDRSLMALLRHFVLCTLKYNILFHAKHIAGRVKRESDALSRLRAIMGFMLGRCVILSYGTSCRGR